MTYINNYFTELWSLLGEMAPYLLLGFLFAGILHVYFPKEKVQRYLGRRNFGSVMNASLIGIPLPLCSCGVIPTGVSFYKNGSSKGSSVSFLISTPQTGVDSILVTYSLLGLPFAIIRPIIALITGVFGGFAANMADKSNTKNTAAEADDCCTIESKSGNKFKTMFRYAFKDFLQDIQKWLVIGILIAALISVIVPNNFFTEQIDSSFLGMLIMLAAAIPLYVCATASVPIAAVLMLKGLSPGAALVFLMAGPATNAATVTVIGKVFGRKTLFTYMASIIAGAILFGFLINTLLPREWFVTGLMEAHEHTHLLPLWFKSAAAVLLILLIANGFYQKYKVKIKKLFLIKKPFAENIKLSTMNTTVIIVQGMTCNHCKSNVENALQSIKGIKKAEADITSGEVMIEGDVNEKKIKKAIDNIGYEYKGIKSVNDQG
jgi:hypothetical protein